MTNLIKHVSKKSSSVIFQNNESNTKRRVWAGGGWGKTSTTKQSAILVYQNVSTIEHHIQVCILYFI